MTKQIGLLLIFWGFFYQQNLYAQTPKLITVGMNAVSGSNINNPDDKEFGTSKPTGIELYYHRWHEGDKYWEKLYNYPYTGWSLTWLNHHNTFLGHTVVLNRYMNYIFLRRKHFECYLKLAHGVMFTNNIYESGTNKNENYNNAISQRFNFCEEIGLGIYFYPTKHLNINVSTTVNHFSNGALSQPNDGLNILGLYVGLAYSNLNKSPIITKNPEKETDNRRVRLNMSLGGGYKQINPEDETKYPLATLNLYLDKKIASISALNIGADLFMNSAVKHSISTDPDYQGVDYKRIGIVAGHELFINRVSLLTQLGYHIYSPYPALAPFYQKLGIKYYITDKLYVGYTVRAFQFAISDEVSWGLGMRL